MSTVGLESKVEEVWRWVIDKSVGKIAILGVGGVGKTTLLKQIYTKMIGFPCCFDNVIWVTVSRSFSLEKVQDDIWKRIGVFNAEWVDKSSREKAKSIRSALSKGMFVLLFDDLGEFLDLRKVGVVEPEEEDESDQMRFPGPRNNCKIIFTTRSEEVCREMGAEVTTTIESLEWEHAWRLFKKMVGEEKLRDPKFLELAQFFATPCDGLPMLLRTVGRALASKATFEEWQAAIEGIRSQVLQEGGKLFFPILLKFCFQSLDQNTRSCLSSFSLYPEDFTILKNELIDFWICQHLIGHGDAKEHGDALTSGYKTIDALVRACLLEEDGINSVKLLDLIRDSALEMEKWFGISERNPLLRGGYTQVGWASQMRKSIQNLTVGSESFFTFLLNHNPFVMLKGDVMKYLTVLDLSNSGVEEIPRDIAELVWLETLILSHSWIVHLPVEIKKLVRLKCLNLEYNELLRVVPMQLIAGLLNLEILKLFRCGYSVEEVNDNMLSARYVDIEPIFGLEHLKVLSILVTCLFALKKLLSNHKLLSITQSLSLEVLWGVKSLDFSGVATMKNLHALEIRQVEDLKEVNGFTRSIDFVSKKGFENLREITLEKCSSLKELTWVVLVPKLTIFTVKYCEEIEQIVSVRRLEEMFDGQDLEPFAKLEVVVLESLPKLESIYKKALPFQQLKKIEVTDCCMLKKLPLNSTSAKGRKVVIETEETWWNDIEWEDDGVKGIFVPCFKPVDGY